MKQKIILYIAMSIDGFIATPDLSVNWLDKYNNSGDDFGYNQFIKNIDTQILGETTYNQFKEVYNNENKLNTIVFSKNKTSTDNNNNNNNNKLKFVNQTPTQLINSLDKNTHKNIWIVGGANITNQFLKENLIDEIILSIMPEILGSGIRLFSNDNNISNIFKLKNINKFKKNVIQLHYTK